LKRQKSPENKYRSEAKGTPGVEVFAPVATAIGTGESVAARDLHLDENETDDRGTVLCQEFLVAYLRQ